MSSIAAPDETPVRRAETFEPDQTRRLVLSNGMRLVAFPDSDDDVQVTVFSPPTIAGYPGYQGGHQRAPVAVNPLADTSARLDHFFDRMRGAEGMDLAGAENSVAPGTYQVPPLPTEFIAAYRFGTEHWAARFEQAVAEAVLAGRQVAFRPHRNLDGRVIGVELHVVHTTSHSTHHSET